MLDLTNLPPLPSFYNANAYFELQHGIFLRQFIQDLSKPIVHDGREHTEYVPTQILTEYFRLRFTTTDGKRLGGILYPSAKIRKGICVVLFYGWDCFDPDRLSRSDDVPIELVPDFIKTGRVRCRPARPDLD